MTLDTYEANISFTWIDEINPENEKPGSCEINEKLFEIFFKLCMKDCEMISYEKKEKSYKVLYKTNMQYMMMMLQIQNFRFKINKRLAKVGDIMLLMK